MIPANTLRDRVDDVIASMERQFGVASPTFEQLVRESLAGSKTAYAALQATGRNLLAPFIDVYGLAAGTLAAEWYDMNRELAQIGGPWSGAVVQDPNIDTGPMVGGSLKDFVSVETVISGIQAGIEMRVRQAAQGTVMDSTLRDPRARGWGRSTSAGCCSYCAMLAGRGSVYRTQHTATFMPHLNCHCQAYPEWSGSAVSLRSREDTIATRRKLSADPEKDKKLRATQNSQARSWIEQNKDTLGLI